jgi:hypothetical protein
MKNILLIWCLFYTSLTQAAPPTGVGGQTSNSVNYSNNTIVPYSQATKLAGVNTLIETGSENMLVNPGFEGLLFNGWTCTVGTCAKTTTAGQFSSGKSALSVALTAQAMNVSQTVTTVSGIQKQGFVRVLYRVPATMTDFQICSLVDAAEQTCVPTANLIKDDTFRSIEIPLIFGSTSAGIKFKTTSSYTATAYFDGAILAQGLGTQNLMLDNVYSALVRTTTGARSRLSKEGWITSCTAANPSVCTISGFTSPPNCFPAADTLVNGVSATVQVDNNTQITIATYDTNTKSGVANIFVNIMCQKQGNDYLASSANVYSQASANTNWAACTFSSLADITTGFYGTGTVTNNLECRRDSGSLNMRGTFTVGIASANEIRIPMPTNYGTILTASTISNDSYGLLFRNTTGENTVFNAISTVGLGYFKVSGSLASSITSSNPSSPVVGSTAFSNGNVITLSNVSIPIQGWTNSNVIVGSFDGIEKCASAAECTDVYSAKVSTTSGTVLEENLDFINTCSANNGTACTFNSGHFTVAPNCQATPTGTSTAIMSVSGLTASGVTVTSYNPTTLALQASQPFVLMCQKQGVDYKPKTAKVASSIGVPTVPGVTTAAVDTFSVAFGAGAVTTPCNVTTCLIAQNSNAVTSVTRAGAGDYTMTTARSYATLFCTLTHFQNATASVHIRAASLACTSGTCTTATFTTGITGVGNNDSAGTLSCQGTY